MQNASELPEIESTAGAGAASGQGPVLQGVIDMTPNLNSDTYNKLVQALGTDAIADDTKRQPRPYERFLTKAEREALTQVNVARILEQLEFTSERLQGAMHRIGYLESQSEAMQDQLAFLPDFRARAARAIVLERQNWELKDIIEQRNLQLVKRERMLADKNEQISILEKLLAAHRKHLDMVEKDLEALENNPWVRFWAWFSGTPLPRR